MAIYGDDLAYIHHHGYGFFAEAEAPRLAALLKQHHARTVVELGCGSGIVARHLTQAGFAVTGIDASPAMIRLARRVAPKAKFAVGSFTKAPPRADAVIAVGEVFNYGRGDLLPVFRRIRKATRLFTFDFAGPGRAGGHGTSKSFTLAPDWAVLVKRKEAGNHLTRRITSFVKRGNSYRRSDEEHVVTLYTPAAMLRLLAKAGFKPRLRAAHAPGHYAVLAT
jgi:SAM-dependent methyltransferase